MKLKKLFKKKWMIGGIIGSIIGFLVALIIFQSTRCIPEEGSACILMLPVFWWWLIPIFGLIIGAVIGLLFDNSKKIKRMFK